MLGQKRPYDPGGYGGWHEGGSTSSGEKKARAEPASMTPEEAEFFRLTGIKPERWQEQVEEVASQQPARAAEATSFPSQAASQPQSMSGLPAASESPCPMPMSSLPPQQAPALGMASPSAPGLQASAPQETFAPNRPGSVFAVPPAPVNEIGMAQQMLLGQMMQQQMMMQMMSQSGFGDFGQPQEEVREEDPLNPDNDPNRFSGRIKGFYEIASGGGYGFIDCEAARIRYGRDVYLHSRQMGDAKVGELISFTIVRNAKGEPQARNVMRAEEALALKAKIQARERREQEQKKQKHQMLEKVTVAEKRTGVMTEEEAKRFQASLRKNRQ
mmetsp:Transcript_21996/g.51596  ORF Transcript_21996/g.51596 Transcript_21996/m.51596 type:complete len:328 (-) Transcript_21996:71-1054(-)|eukprot:s1139_g28.t1